MTKIAVAGGCVAVLIVGSFVSLRAITFGWPDGDGHPNVGTLVAELDGVKVPICSGTLVSPNVVLTAGHCTSFIEPNQLQVWFSFDSVFDEATATLHDIAAIVTHPEYHWRQNDPADMGLLVLDEPAAGLTPATLPAIGLLDALFRARSLRPGAFTAVGYGIEVSFFGGPPAFFGGDTRMFSLPSFNALNQAWLRLSQNPSTGDSGTCYGDSGGPNFLEIDGVDVLVAITVTGDAMCRATNVTYRLDTEVAQSFLAANGVLP